MEAMTMAVNAAQARFAYLFDIVPVVDPQARCLMADERRVMRARCASASAVKEVSIIPSSTASSNKFNT